MSDLWSVVAEPAPTGPSEPGGAWDQGVRAAVSALRVGGTPTPPPPSVASAWALLSWCEGSASLLLNRAQQELLSDALFALVLLEPALDRRDVLNVARLLRFAAERVGLDYRDGVRAARCPDQALAAALERVPASVPTTHRLVVGADGELIERISTPVDVDELSRRFGP